MEFHITIPDSFSDADLSQLYTELDTAITAMTGHRDRVLQLLNAEAAIANAQYEYHTALTGGIPPEPPMRGDVDMSAWFPWQAPTGAHNAYPRDWVVQHNGKLYRSTASHSDREPGTTGAQWEDVTPGPGEPLPESPTDDITIEPWEAWYQYSDGCECSYDEDGNPNGRDYVSYQGVAYGCVLSHKSQPDWTPDVTPSLWAVVGPLPDGEADTDGDDNDVDVEPWMSGMSVIAGSVVSHNGFVWEAVVAHTTHAGWEPSDSAWAVWKKRLP